MPIIIIVQYFIINSASNDNKYLCTYLKTNHRPFRPVPPVYDFIFFGYCQTEKEQSLSLLFYSNSKTVVLGSEQKVGNHSIRKLFEMQAVPSRMVEDQHKKFLK